MMTTMKNPKQKRIFSGSRTSRFAVKRRAVLGLFAGGAAAAVAWQLTGGTRRAEAATPVTLYKNPQCSCCEAYASYLDEHGFDVKVISTNDLTAVGEKYGITEAMQPCHLSLVQGYAVGGHIPVEVVQRLLNQKPQITGITLPGMPEGMPGMPGHKPDRVTIYEIGKGEPKVYAVV
jgi:hypothetical protein